MKIFVLHIPKTGGTAIAKYFSSYFKGNVYGASHDIHVQSDFAKYKSNIIKTYSFIQGHIPLSSILDFIDEFDFVIAVYRDPFNRMISHYNYISSTETFDGFLEKHYLNNICTRNEQCGYIGKINTCESAIESLSIYKNLIVFDYDRLKEHFFSFCVANKLGNGALPVANTSINCKIDVSDIACNKIAIDAITNWFSDDFLFGSFLKKRGINCGK